MKPLASFIVPVFNESKNIRKCIDSLLGQTEPNFEIVIIDDGSIDDTSEMLTAYCDPRICVYRQENRGRMVARNRGLELSQGKYVILQDADDWSEPDRLENQLELAERCSGSPFVGTGVIFHREGQEGTIIKTFPETDKDIRRIMSRLVFRQAVLPATMLALREQIIEMGGWRQKFRLAGEDGDLISRLFEETDVVFFNTSKALYHYRHNFGSVTNKLSVTIPQQMFMRFCERARRKGMPEPRDFKAYQFLMNSSGFGKMKYSLEYVVRCLYSYSRWRFDLFR